MTQAIISSPEISHEAPRTQPTAEAPRTVVQPTPPTIDNAKSAEAQTIIKKVAEALPPDVQDAQPNKIGDLMSVVAGDNKLPEEGSLPTPAIPLASMENPVSETSTESVKTSATNSPALAEKTQPQHEQPQPEAPLPPEVAQWQQIAKEKDNLTQKELLDLYNEANKYEKNSPARRALEEIGRQDLERSIERFNQKVLSGEASAQLPPELQQHIIQQLQLFVTERDLNSLTPEEREMYQKWMALLNGTSGSFTKNNGKEFIST